MAADIKDWSANDLENLMLDDINLSREQGGEVAKLMGAIKRKFDDVDLAISGVAGAYTYKGTVDTVADLPASGSRVGDVYNVTSGTDGGNYAWDGAEWDKTGDSLVDVDGAQVIARGSTTKRTLGDRFADVVNVKDFGAKGDGTTDDTVAFEALESVARGRFVNLGGALYAVDSIPTGCIYYNGRFIVDGETIEAQSCKLCVEQGTLTGWGMTGRDYVFIGDMPNGFDPNVQRSLIGIGAGVFDGLSPTDNINDCIAIGPGVMSEGSSGNFNIGLGTFALHNADGGDRNVAVGSLSLMGVSTGSMNVALGRNAGQCVTTGSGGVFIGYRASGGYGYMELDGKLHPSNPITGDGNVCVGVIAGNLLSGGAEGNTFIGQRSGSNIKIGTGNTAVGSFALLHNGVNTSVNGKTLIQGTLAGTYSQSGTTVTVTMPGHHAVAGCYVIIKFTNGALETATAGLTCFLYVDSVIDENTFTIESSNSLTASGNCSCEVFEQSVESSESQDSSTAVGNQAGRYWKSIGNSVFVGALSGTGTSSTADPATSCTNSNFVGCFTATHCTSVKQCDMIGYGAGRFAEGALQYSVCIGYEAASVATSLEATVAIGRQAGKLCSSHASNVFVGMSAGSRPANLLRCTAVGSTALYSASDSTAITNSTAIGYGSQVTGDNQVQLGDTSTTTYAYGAVQDRSDARDKADIRDTRLGLDFLCSLRPVDFRWDYRDSYIDYVEDGEDEDGNAILVAVQHEKDGSRKRSRFHHGLIAQEVKAVLDERGIDFGGYQDHKINGGKDILTLGYEEFIAPIIKSLQEINSRLEVLESA